ncbi:MAG: translesion error-prone DNA polymerase V autoproteolytic subunit [Ginsengibacter sp.]
MLTEPSIVSISTPVKCGFPSPAMDYMEERIDLNSELIKHPLSTFLIECEGNSMIDAFIPPRAKLLIDRSINPKNGDIVLAILDGEFTVKYLRKNDFKCWLVPANKKLKEIEITSDRDFQVWGVVISIIVNPDDTKCLL